jgi:mevalonate kinase
VIQIVSARQSAEPEHYQRIYERIDLCVRQAIAALEEQNWRQWGELMNQHHALHTELGVSTPLLDELAADLRLQSQIYGAKISGSGLGDCVVGMGTIVENLFPLNADQSRVGVRQIPVKISKVGYRVE